jgi:hypothetical protein
MPRAFDHDEARALNLIAHRLGFGRRRDGAFAADEDLRIFAAQRFGVDALGLFDHAREVEALGRGLKRTLT